MKKNIFLTAFLIVVFFILFDINVNAAELEPYITLTYTTQIDYTVSGKDGYTFYNYDGLQLTGRLAESGFDNFAILRSDQLNESGEVYGYKYEIYVVDSYGYSAKLSVGYDASFSSIPEYAYYKSGIQPTNSSMNWKDIYLSDFDTVNNMDLRPSDWKSYPTYNRIDVDTNIPMFNDITQLENYLLTGDTTGQIINFNKAIFNDTIGYLKNVVLKMDNVNHKKFTVSWTTDEELFMSDDWRIQIGFFTRFQKHLFGDKFIHTNLNYITYDDELYYHLGKWQVNLDDVYDSIPDCNHPHYKGNFYLRLVHVDTSTGLVEFGPWGQLSWHLNQGNTEGLAYIVSEYKTIESSNVIEEEGTFDLIEEEYVVNTTHPDSQDYVINADKGTIGTEFGGINFSDVDLSNIGNTFMNGMSALGDTLKNFPTLMGKVASFLPKEIVTLITIGFALVIALRIWGR